ncbi:hypothetical protein DXG01_009828, partial [Tephrocybe rancida]
RCNQTSKHYLPVTEGSSTLTSVPVLEKQTASDDMDVDPEDDILDYGMTDDEMQPVAPTETAISTAEPSVALESASCSLRPEEGGTSDINEDMPLTESQPDPILNLISRQEAGSLGVIDLVATHRPTEFLVVTGAPIKEVTWGDYLATMVHLIEDGSLYEGQLYKGGEQLFWMRSPSDRATIAGRGYLSARHTIDGVTLNCSFVSHTEYVDAWQRHTNIWPEEDVSGSDPPPPDSSIATTSTIVHAPLPPSITYRFSTPTLLRDRAVEREVVEEELQVPLEQRLSSRSSISLLSHMQVPEVSNLVDRLGGIGPSASKGDNSEGHDGDIEDEDMEELPGNKRRPWKPRGKRAGKKHHKEPPENPSIKDQHQFDKDHKDHRGGNGGGSSMTYSSVMVSS